MNSRKNNHYELNEKLHSNHQNIKLKENERELEKNYDEKINYSKKDNIQNEQNFNRNKYDEIRKDYRNIAHKEQTIQVTSSIFALCTSGLEILVFLLVNKLLERNVPLDIIFRYMASFFILTIITLLTIIQLIIITKWNKSLKQQKTSLTLVNYKIIDQAKMIQALILLIVLLNILFTLVLKQTEIGIVPKKFIAAVLYYQRLRQMANILVIAFTILEIWQLIRWTNRIHQYNEVERILIKDLPDLEELEEIADLDYEFIEKLHNREFLTTNDNMREE